MNYSKESRKTGNLELEDLTGKIIGCAIAVQMELGPGFLESIYENALLLALKQDGIEAEAQRIIPVYFRGHQVGEHRLDILVANQVIVELKAIKALEDVHFAQVRSYLKAFNSKHGLLFNFSTAPLTIKRVLHDIPSCLPALLSDDPSVGDGLL
jgi:GxxExxY protein